VILRARRIIGGRASGRAVVSPEPLSFWGDLDPVTGRVSNPRHAAAGRELAGRVLVFPQGRGSSSAAQVLLEAIRRGTAPAAIVNLRTEPLLAVGPLVGQALYGRGLPVVTVSPDDFARIEDGALVVVDADEERLEVVP
jgi:predicted aconitase with swiveling domain